MVALPDAGSVQTVSTGLGNNMVGDKHGGRKENPEILPARENTAPPAVAVALGVGLVSGAVAHFAGSLVAGVLSGLAGTATTAAGMVLWPLARLLRAETAAD